MKKLHQAEIIHSDYYEELQFVKLELSDSEKLQLISILQEAYENTDQDTAVFAVEFEVLVRYLLQGYMILNPNHLLIEEVLENLTDALNGDNAELFGMAYQKVNNTNWIGTDELQYLRRFSEFEFEVIDGIAFPDYIRIDRHFIDLADYLDNEESLIQDYCTQYGYHSLDKIKEDYPDDYLQVIAEFIAEVHTGTEDGEEIAQFKTEEEAEKFFAEYTKSAYAKELEKA